MAEDESQKSPWQIEHEKMLAAEEAKREAERKQQRAARLRGMKLTRKSDPSLHEIVEGQAAQEPETFVEEVPLERSPEVERPKRQRERVSLSAILAPIGPALRRAWPFLVIFLLIFLGAFYATSPMSHVGAFKVSGNSQVSASDIAAASKIKVNDSVASLLLEKGKIEARVVNSAPEIKSADLVIKAPNTVTLRVTEYKPVGYVLQKNNYYIVLANGIIIKTETVQKSKIPATALVLTNFTDSQVRTFTQAFSSFPSSLQALFRTVTFKPSQATKDFLNIPLSDGNTVKVPLSQFKEKMPYYPSIAEHIKSPTTVDMEVGYFAAATPTYNSEFAGNVPQTSTSGSSSSTSSSSSAVGQ
ncbi:MAG: FtsQ-type POTRA domain-containing protein [Streptococcaceae bacterium]|jgi:cell division protein FtsQ|nr:FtsQ-type POTRA domain-containing protein [Streptococcaceae bacterium]